MHIQLKSKGLHNWIGFVKLDHELNSIELAWTKIPNDTFGEKNVNYHRRSPITLLPKCVMKIVHIQVKSPNTEVRFFQPQGTSLKGKNSLPAGANSFLKSWAIA